MANNVIELDKRLIARNAVILARVSSKEQEEGYSIDAQKHRLETYCNRRGLSVIKTFEITESSTNGDRRKFMALIKFVKSQREPIAIVADKVDRVQRSFKEYPLLDALIQQGKIELHFNTENYVIHKDSVSQERLMWSMGVIMAQSYIDSMRDNVKRSFDQKIRMGEWIAKAPLGYLNVKDDKGRSDIVLDPDNAPLVRRLFEEYATGAYTIPEMVKKAKAWGIKNKFGKKSYPQKSLIHRMLTNPFYYGQMLIKGELHPHRYEPLITKHLFDKCQAVIGGYNRKPFKYGKHEYVFRGLITCAVTGKVVTSETHKKTYKNGGESEWTYLRAGDPAKPDKSIWIREEKIMEQVEDVFRALTIPKERLESVIAYIRGTDHTEREFRNRQTGELNRQLKMIESRSDALMDLIMDGVIDRAEYARKKKELHEQQMDIRSRLEAVSTADDKFKECLIALISLASEAHDLFKGSNTAQKRKLINDVFLNLSLKGTTLCYTLKKPFDQFVKCTDLNKWQGRQDLNLRPMVLETIALPTELHP